MASCKRPIFCLLLSFFIYPVFLNTVYVVHSLLTKWYRFNSRYLSPSFLNSSNLTQNETLVRLHHFFRVMLATRPFSQTIGKMPEDPYLFPLFLVQHKVYDLSRADRAWIVAAYKLEWPIFVYNYYLLVSLNRDIAWETWSALFWLFMTVLVIKNTFGD